MWQSADPAFTGGVYFPTGDKDRDKNLPGMGGIYKSLNVAVYTYTHQNPVRLTDPDGNLPTAINPSEHPINSPYGVRTHPVTRQPGQMHNGVDQAAPAGTNVHALWSGTVYNTDTVGAGTGGKLVLLSHGKVKQGDHAGKYLYSRYLHNSAISVEPGQKVGEGQKVAEVGTTGTSTGNHTHFDVIISDTPLQRVDQPDAQFVNPASIDPNVGQYHWSPTSTTPVPNNFCTPENPTGE